MEGYPLYVRFESIIKRMLEQIDLDVEEGVRVNNLSPKRIDLVAKSKLSHDFKIYIELKFYRSDRVSTSILMSAAAQLAAYFPPLRQNIVGLLIITSYAAKSLKDEVKEKTGMILWDRSDIYIML